MSINAFTGDIVVEAKELTTAFKKRETSIRKWFNEAILPTGFYGRLGALMLNLKARAEADDKKQVSQKMCEEYGIGEIDRQRRSEALFFAENYDDMIAFRDEHEPGCNSLQVLVNKYKAHIKPASEDKSVQDKASDVTESEDGSEDTAGLNPEGEAHVLTATELAANTLKIAAANGINIDTLIKALKSQIVEMKEAA